MKKIVDHSADKVLETETELYLEVLARYAEILVCHPTRGQIIIRSGRWNRLVRKELYRALSSEPTLSK